MTAAVGDPLVNPTMWIKDGWYKCDIFNVCDNADLCNSRSVRFRHIIYTNSYQNICPQFVPIKGAVNMPDGWKPSYWKYCSYLQTGCRSECQNKGLLVASDESSQTLLDICPMDCISEDGWTVTISPEVIQKAVEIELENGSYLEDEPDQIITAQAGDSTSEKPEPKYIYRFRYWTQCFSTYNECGLNDSGMCDGFVAKVNMIDAPYTELYICSCEIEAEQIENFIPRRKAYGGEAYIKSPVVSAPKPKVLFFQSI